MTTRLLLSTLLAAGLSGTASAQRATSLVESGDALVVNGVSTAVAGIGPFNVSPVGGYAMVADDGTQGFLLGSAGAAPPSLLASEGPLSGFTITRFMTAPDIANDGTIAFGVRVDGRRFFTSVVYRDDVPVAIDDAAVPASTGINGGVFRASDNPQLSSDGARLAFSAAIDLPDRDGLSTSAIFADGGSRSVLQFFGSTFQGNTSSFVSGDEVAGNILGSHWEFSSDGSRFISRLNLGFDPSVDRAVAVGELGGAVTVPTVAGSPLREGSLVSTGSTDRWDDFRRFGIGDDGTYLFTGSLAGGDAFLALNGSIALRTGDAVAGAAGVVDGAFETAEVNNTGDYAAIVAIGGSETLVVNGAAVLTLGDLVGVAGGVQALTSFEVGRDRLGITDAVDGRFDVFFTGGTAGVDQAFFVVNVPEPGFGAIAAIGGLLLTRRNR